MFWFSSDMLHGHISPTKVQCWVNWGSGLIILINWLFTNNRFLYLLLRSRIKNISILISKLRVRKLYAEFYMVSLFHSKVRQFKSLVLSSKICSVRIILVPILFLPPFLCSHVNIYTTTSSPYSLDEKYFVVKIFYKNPKVIDYIVWVTNNSPKNYFKEFWTNVKDKHSK